MSDHTPATRLDIDRLEATVERLARAIEQQGQSTRQELEGLRQQLEQQAQNTRQELDRVVETMRDIETHMLTEFHRYARGQQSRLHTLESNDNDIRVRLGALEERVLELEGRIRPPRQQ